jgi:hypothetical protein
LTSRAVPVTTRGRPATFALTLAVTRPVAVAAADPWIRNVAPVNGVLPIRSRGEDSVCTSITDPRLADTHDRVAGVRSTNTPATARTAHVCTPTPRPV